MLRWPEDGLFLPRSFPVHPSEPLAFHRGWWRQIPKGSPRCPILWAEGPWWPGCRVRGLPLPLRCRYSARRAVTHTCHHTGDRASPSWDLLPSAELGPSVCRLVVSPLEVDLPRSGGLGQGTVGAAAWQWRAGRGVSGCFLSAPALSSSPSSGLWSCLFLHCGALTCRPGCFWAFCGAGAGLSSRPQTPLTCCFVVSQVFLLHLSVCHLLSLCEVPGGRRGGRRCLEVPLNGL